MSKEYSEIEILRRYDEVQERGKSGEDHAVLEQTDVIKIIQKRGQVRLQEAVRKNLTGENIFMKAHFHSENGLKENMWLQVTGYKKKKKQVTGWLASDPMLIENLSRGDKVTVDFEDIIDVLIEK